MVLKLEKIENNFGKAVQIIYDGEGKNILDNLILKLQNTATNLGVYKTDFLIHLSNIKRELKRYTSKENKLYKTIFFEDNLDSILFISLFSTIYQNNSKQKKRKKLKDIQPKYQEEALKHLSEHNWNTMTTIQNYNPHKKN